LLPHSHLLSWRQAQPSLLDLAAAAMERVVAGLECAFGPISTFEHGVGDSGSAGCGVTHAHLHLLPLSPDIARDISRRITTDYPPRSHGRWPQVLSAITRAEEYVTFAAGDETVLVTGHFPSQYVRRLIGERLAIPWDWRDLTGSAAFAATLAATRELGAAA
jgi:diadenosine tetraphosphate (Ap4A) HIT family hydrolase